MTTGHVQKSATFRFEYVLYPSVTLGLCFLQISYPLSDISVCTLTGLEFSRDGILDLPCSANITLTLIIVSEQPTHPQSMPGVLCSHGGAQKEPSPQPPSDQFPDLRSPVFTTPVTKFLFVVFWLSCLAHYSILVMQQRYISTLLQTNPLRALPGVVDISHGRGQLSRSINTGDLMSHFLVNSQHPLFSAI